LERWIVGHRIHALNPLVEGLTYAGTYGLLWIVIAAVFAVTLRRRRIFVSVLIADAVAEFSTDALKALTDRARPAVHTLVAEPSSSSFPSGHAATSFACAVVLAGLLPRFRVAVLVLATLVAVSRLYVGVHFPTDVLAGAAWGGAIGLGVLTLVRRRS
jgi:undecaprenyl-diphosphatase